jgi:hypothetical protein
VRQRSPEEIRDALKAGDRRRQANRNQPAHERGRAGNNQRIAEVERRSRAAEPDGDKARQGRKYAQ